MKSESEELLAFTSGVERITVDEALNHGKKAIVLPATVLLFVLNLLALVLILIDFSLLIWGIGIMSLSIPVVWLYWSWMSVRWKVWAYPRVIHIHTLYNQAIRKWIIWPIGSWVSKTEIHTRQSRLICKHFESIIQNEDELMEDDPSVPAMMMLMPAFKPWWQPIVRLGAGLVGAFLLWYKSGFSFTLWLIGGYGLYYLYELLKKFFGPPLQPITLTEKGISLSGRGLIRWKNIRSPFVDTHRQTLHFEYCEEGQNPENKETRFTEMEFDLSEYDCAPAQLDQVIRIYRFRARATSL